MKKFDIKDVFSWSNAEDAKQYIGKYCYFADSLRYLKDSVNKDINYLLKEVFNNEKDQVQGVFCDVDGDFWGLCLPAEKVKEVEEPKKYRPFKNADELQMCNIPVSISFIFNVSTQSINLSNWVFVYLSS